MVPYEVCFENNYRPQMQSINKWVTKVWPPLTGILVLNCKIEALATRMLGCLLFYTISNIYGGHLLYTQ
jgi:hypothetical protein